MSVWPQLRDLFVLVPIVGLLLLGMFVAVSGGVMSLRQREGQLALAANLTSVLLRIAAFVGVLLLVQRMVGAPL